MLDSVTDWMIMEGIPALGVLWEMSVSAVDSIPLPALIIIFLVLFACLRYPLSGPSTPILPSYSPTLSEKTRLSPLLHPAQTAGIAPMVHPSRPILYPAFQIGKAHSATDQFASEASASGLINGASAISGSPRGRGRRGRCSWSAARRGSELGVVDEVVEEKAEEV